MSKVVPPQNVMNAMGVLIMYGLTQGFDVDGGFFMESSDLAAGEPGPNSTPIGGWRIEVQRTSLPTATKER